MTFFNETPFAAEIFEQLNMQGRMNGVVAIRGGFVARPDRRLAPADETAAFVWEDTYAGDPLRTPLVAVGDLVPFKPGTDVTFLGSSFAPGGEALRSWLCGIEIPDRAKKVLRVTGPRAWVPKTRERRRLFTKTDKDPIFEGWTLSDPEPARETPICWTQAFGGCHAASDALDAELASVPDNWIGVGWLDEARSVKTQPLPAPRIESPDDPIKEWHRDAHVPQGLSPIPPFWVVRRRHAGTIDEAWLAERHPLAPKDFDFRFWQSATPDCVIDRWLSGHEVITLTNLHREHAELRVALPGVALRARQVRRGRPDEVHPVVLDGVHFDFRGGSNAVALTWRAGFPWPDGDGDVVLEGGAGG